MRVRHVAETRDPESFAQNPAWTANYEATKDLPAATGDDIVWADAVIFGSPTRFGSPSSQLRDVHRLAGRAVGAGQARRQGLRGVHVVTDRARRPGDHAADALHHADAFRRHHRAARIHRSLKFVDGNPYGVSLTAAMTTSAEFDDATATPWTIWPAGWSRRRPPHLVKLPHLAALTSKKLRRKPMPLYQCLVPAGSLDADTRDASAEAITTVHYSVICVPRIFVNVVFTEYDPAAYFTGGRRNTACRDHRNIRADRTSGCRANS